MKPIKILALAAFAFIFCEQSAKAWTPYGIATFNQNDTPVGTLVIQGDWLYGVTQYGGANGVGSIYTVNTNGTGALDIFDFTPDSTGPHATGGVPYGGLMLDSDTLYGTTSSYGFDSYGTVFSIKTNGTSFSALHSFPSSADDGVYPATSLVLYGTNLYGTTVSGGTNSEGTVFKISENGTGYQVLHSFNNVAGFEEGFNPEGRLFLTNNIIYGTTYAGSTNVGGSVFSLNTDGSNFRVLHSFVPTNDGFAPFGGIIISGTNLYGTTSMGGPLMNSVPAAEYYGTVYAINTNGSGFHLVHYFGQIGDSSTSPQGDLGYFDTGSGVELIISAAFGTATSGSIFWVSTDGGLYSQQWIYGGSPTSTHPNGVLYNQHAGGMSRRFYVTATGGYHIGGYGAIFGLTP